MSVREFRVWDKLDTVVNWGGVPNDRSIGPQIVRARYGRMKFHVLQSPKHLPSSEWIDNVPWVFLRDVGKSLNLKLAQRLGRGWSDN